MRRILLTLTLCFTSLFSYSKYEVGVGYGLTSLVDHIQLDTPSHQLTFRKNDLTFYDFTPRIDLEYLAVDEVTAPSSDLFRISLNGVYDFEGANIWHLFTYGGLGYEYLNTPVLGANDEVFFQVGVGVKYDLREDLALKVESKVVKIFDNSFDEGVEYQTIVGLVFYLNNAPKPEPKKPVYLEQRIQYLKEKCLLDHIPYEYMTKGNNCLLETKLDPYAKTYKNELKKLAKFLNREDKLDVYIKGYVNYRVDNDGDFIILSQKVIKDLSKEKFDTNRIKLSSGYLPYVHTADEKYRSDDTSIKIIMKLSKEGMEEVKSKNKSLKQKVKKDSNKSIKKDSKLINEIKIDI